MTKGPWRYKKAQGHHHVLFPNGEVLDVENKSDAQLISLVPDMIFALSVIGNDFKILTAILNKIQKAVNIV
jgi:hypothetical protein